MSFTLVDIINDIKPKKSNQSKYPINNNSQQLEIEQIIQQSKSNIIQSRWTNEQNKIFNTFINKYGADFSLILGELPKKTRKQIRKKFNKSQCTKKKRVTTRKRIEEQRKTSTFEQNVLELAAFEVEQQNNKNKNIN